MARDAELTCYRCGEKEYVNRSTKALIRTVKSTKLKKETEVI